MLDSLSPYLTTNMVRGRMINEINRAIIMMFSRSNI